MRYRPWPSVTTILANFVGRSEVSAITHTPASGPVAPLTTPAMSSPSIVVPPGARRALQAAQSSAEPATAKSALVVFILAVPLMIFAASHDQSRRSRQGHTRERGTQ